MLISGIIGREGKIETANLINSLLSSAGKKISVLDSKSLTNLDGVRFKSFLRELEANKFDMLLLKINMSDMDKTLDLGLHMDVVIFTDREECLNQNERDYQKVLLERLSGTMADKSMAIVNVDDTDLVSLLKGMKQCMITYGFNSNASITASSTGDSVYKEGFICCLQRKISAKDLHVPAPQEFKLNLDSQGMDTHNLLAAASFAIVNGIDLNNISLS